MLQVARLAVIVVFTASCAAGTSELRTSASAGHRKGLSPPQIHASMMATAVPVIRHCYEAASVSEPFGLSGSMRVAFTIHPNGTPTDASLVESTFDRPEMERCMLDAVLAATFPNSGKATRVSWPIIFGPPPRDAG